jgi:hypothetical protein
MTTTVNPETLPQPVLTVLVALRRLRQALDALDYDEVRQAEALGAHEPDIDYASEIAYDLRTLHGVVKGTDDVIDGMLPVSVKVQVEDPATE